MVLQIKVRLIFCFVLGGRGTDSARTRTSRETKVDNWWVDGIRSLSQLNVEELGRFDKEMNRKEVREGNRTFRK